MKCKTKELLYFRIVEIFTSTVCSYECANGKYEINVSNSVKIGFYNSKKY